MSGGTNDFVTAAFAMPMAMSQSPTTGSAVSSIPQAPVTAKATVTKTQESDLLIDARRRFRRVDQNRDDKIDRLELKLRKVVFHSLIDVNQDGYVTIDETLLSPDLFKQFDSDGDGKISSFEFVDASTFTAIDANRDDFVTFEEYVHFLRIPTQ